MAWHGVAWHKVDKALTVSIRPIGLDLVVVLGPRLCTFSVFLFQVAKDSSGAQSQQRSSEDEAERQARVLARLKSDLLRKEALLRAAQGQLEEVREGQGWGRDCVG